MDLGGAVGAFDFDVLQAHPGWLFATHRCLVLPPEETGAHQHDQQQQADNAQNIVRQTYWLFDPPQAVDVAAVTIGARVVIELLHQYGLIQAEQFSVGTDIAPGKGMPRQLFKIARLDVAQGCHGEVEPQGHIRQRPVFTLTALTQGFTRVCASGCYNFGMRRFHLCSDRYC
jgi:hypothetical protein